jgi:hypothetical protein
MALLPGWVKPLLEYGRCLLFQWETGGVELGDQSWFGNSQDENLSLMRETGCLFEADGPPKGEVESVELELWSYGTS